MMLFSKRLRDAPLSVIYGIAVVLFGGVAPLNSPWLVDTTGNPFAPVFYVMTAAC